MKIDVICPLYNAEQYIEKLDQSLRKQKKVEVEKIRYVLTESTDQTERYLKKNKRYYSKIKKEDFSHSLSREEEALKSNADVLVFITQDVLIEDELFLYHLTKDIGKNHIAATYARQISKYNNIEKYTRENNYPSQDRIVSKKDIKKLGLKTFFFSDAAGAISTKVFKEVEGYDHKRLPISEDMYITYKIIMKGYSVKYCSDAICYHSHKFTLKQIYDRYKLTGKFFKQNPYLDQYGTTGSGASMAKYILKRILEEKRFLLLFRYPFDMAARLIGMKIGKMGYHE